MTELPNQFVGHDAQAEQAVIGSLMFAPDDLQRKIIQRLKPEDFAYPENGIVWAAAMSLYNAGKPLDVLMMRTELIRSGKWAEVGGLEYVQQVFDSVPSATYGEHYAGIVLGLAQQRRGIQKLRQALIRIEKAREEGSADTVLRAVASDLMSAANDRAGVEIYSIGQALQTWYDARTGDDSANRALLTGVSTLDNFAGIFRPGAITLVGGRPGMGKSTFCRWLLGQWAMQGVRVGLIGLEENRHKVAGNYISATTGIENEHVANQKMSGGLAAQFVDAIASMADLPWFGTDKAFKLGQIVAAAETMIVDRKCGVVCIDHIHLIQGERAENRNQQLSEISRVFKQLAATHNVSLIVAAQLSRPEKGAGIPPPPRLTDLRDSGTLEQDADSVLMLHRPDYYRNNINEHDKEVQVWIRKQRNGPSGGLALRDELMYQRFAELPHKTPFDGSSA